MSAIIPAGEFALAVARSNFIDAHNAADAAIRHRLAALKAPSHALLGQNIEALAKVAANPTYSKLAKDKVAALLNELKLLQPIRCDIVHAKMERLMIDGVVHGFFANVQNQPLLGRTGLLLTIDQIQDCSKQLARIARGLAV